MVEFVGILVFALLIGVSIALHEVGHLIPAKRFKVKVTEYMVGFGPTVWSTRRGETAYGIKAVPLGGYIRMIGMMPPGPDGRLRATSTGRFAQLVDDARRASAAEIGPGEQARAFYRLPVRKRIVVMLGGPTMNLLLACVLFGIVLVGIGLPRPTLEVASVQSCTPTAAQPTAQPLPSGRCPQGSQPSPAAASGLRPGDEIRAIGGTAVDTWADATAWIRANPGVRTELTVRRDGLDVDLPVTIASAVRPSVDESGNVTSGFVTAGYLGVAPQFAWEPQPITAVPAFMWDLTARSVVALVSLPVRLYELVADTLVGGQERSIDSPVSVVGASRLGGDIAAMDEPLRAKAATFLGLIASLNLFLFLFNLVPILPLDGGHIAGAAYEGGRRWLARRRGLPDPGPVDLARLLPVAYIATGALLLMGLVVIWADLVKPLSMD